MATQNITNPPGEITSRYDISTLANIYTRGTGYISTLTLSCENIIAKNDISLNKRLFVGGNGSFGNNINVYGDISLNNRLFVGGDVSFGKNICFNGDISLNNRLFVGGDFIINAPNKNITFYDNDIEEVITTKNNVIISREYIGTGTFINYKDSSFNGRLYVDKTITSGGNVIIKSNLDVSGNSYFRNDITVRGNSNFQNGMTVLGDMGEITFSTASMETVHINKLIVTDSSFTGNLYVNRLIPNIMSLNNTTIDCSSLKTNTLTCGNIYNINGNLTVANSYVNRITSGFTYNYEPNVDSLIYKRLPYAQTNINSGIPDQSYGENCFINLTLYTGLYGLGPDSYIHTRGNIYGKTLFFDELCSYNTNSSYSIFNAYNGIGSGYGYFNFSTTTYSPGGVNFGKITCGNVICANLTGSILNVPATTNNTNYAKVDLNKLFALATDSVDSSYPIINVDHINCASIASASTSFPGGMNTDSDNRVKKNIIDLDTEEALDTLRKITPCKYSLIDVNEMGMRTSNNYFGFIAQNIKEIIPDALVEQNGFIPNIYKKALVLDDRQTIKFTEDVVLHEQNKPTKIKIRTFDKKTYIFTLDTIIENTKIRIKELIPDNYLDDKMEIFVFGQQIDDYYSLNYNSIFTIVSASAKQLDIEITKTNNILDKQYQIITQQQLQIEKLQTQVNEMISLLYKST